MAQYQLFILPVIALALVIFRNPFDRDVTLSNSWRSRRRRRVLLTRLTIVALPLATAISGIWPISDLHSLLQSVMISALILLPAFVFHWALLLKQAIKRYIKPGSSTQDDPSNKEPELAVQMTVSPEIMFISHETTTHEDESQTGVQTQLDRVPDLIQPHDLNDADSSLSEQDAGASVKIMAKRDQQLASNTALISNTGHPTDLAKLDTPQIMQLVTSLRKDKTRLQKLVIAQQTAITAERTAHEKTRVTTRDAITIMRRARAGQKNAEKLARRERSERQHLEQQYNKVALDLRNAMSIVKNRKSAPAVNGNTSAAKNVRLSDDVLE